MPTTLGKYIIGRTLGSGASCKVKLAKDEEGTRYAIKLYNDYDDSFDEIFDDEIENLSKIKHPNIVRMIEGGEGT